MARLAAADRSPVLLVARRCTLLLAAFTLLAPALAAAAEPPAELVARLHALSLLAQAPAAAAPADLDAQLQALVVRAQGEYQAGDFAASARTLLSAFALRPIPKLLYNAAIAFEKASDPEQAVAHYQLFIESPGADAELVPKAARALATLREAKLQGDLAERDRLAAQERQRAQEARQALEEARVLEELRIAREQDERVKARAERQRQQDESDSARLRAYLLLGAAGASAGAGTYLGVSALGSRDDWESAERFSDRTTLASSSRSKALFADVSFGLALGLAATGAWLFLDAPAPPAADAGAGRP